MHADDQQLLGMEWWGVVYCDKVFPFGLHSALKLFTAGADGLAWAVAYRGVQNFLQYLADFFLLRPTSLLSCRGGPVGFLPPLQWVGPPSDSRQGSRPVNLHHLPRIFINSLKQELRLLEAKPTQLLNTLHLWSTRQSATNRQLQTLIGQLNHAAAVVRPGRSFMHHLIDTMAIPRGQHHKVHLYLQCKANIARWLLFVRGWNGVALFPNLQVGVAVVADASGSWGCGAYTRRTRE